MTSWFLCRAGLSDKLHCIPKEAIHEAPKEVRLERRRDETGEEEKEEEQVNGVGEGEDEDEHHLETPPEAAEEAYQDGLTPICDEEVVVVVGGGGAVPNRDIPETAAAAHSHSKETHQSPAGDEPETMREELAKDEPATVGQEEEMLAESCLEDHFGSSAATDAAPDIKATAVEEMKEAAAAATGSMEDDFGDFGAAFPMCEQEDAATATDVPIPPPLPATEEEEDDEDDFADFEQALSMEAEPALSSLQKILDSVSQNTA